MREPYVFHPGLPVIIRNSENVYEGDLVPYFRAIFETARNLRHPYHNFRHMLHVTWLCYMACVSYADELDRREARDLLIAALCHDVDHCGMQGDDDLNITRALRWLDKHALAQDRPRMPHIMAMIRATEFPHKTPSESLGLCSQILRDADLAQALNPAWIQQVIFGLASEWGKTPLEILMSQEAFLCGLKFHTAWAQQLFPQPVIDEKIREGRALVEILT